MYFFFLYSKVLQHLSLQPTYDAPPGGLTKKGPHTKFDFEHRLAPTTTINCTTPTHQPKQAAYVEPYREVQRAFEEK